jgi:hypothetical protein
MRYRGKSVMIREIEVVVLVESRARSEEKTGKSERKDGSVGDFGAEVKRDLRGGVCR